MTVGSGVILFPPTLSNKKLPISTIGSPWLVGEAESLPSSSLIGAPKQPLAQFNGLLSQVFHLTDHRPQLLFISAFIHLCCGFLVGAVPTEPEHDGLIPVRPVALECRGLLAAFASLGRHFHCVLYRGTGLVTEESLIASVVNTRNPLRIARPTTATA